MTMKLKNVGKFIWNHTVHIFVGLKKIYDLMTCSIAIMSLHIRLKCYTKSLIHLKHIFISDSYFSFFLFPFFVPCSVLFWILSYYIRVMLYIVSDMKVDVTSYIRAYIHITERFIPFQVISLIRSIRMFDIPFQANVNCSLPKL